MAKQARKESKIIRSLKFPLRALIKARDFYVNAMLNCSGRYHVGASTSSHVSTLPKSYSTSSSIMNGDDEYMRDLIRAASTKSLKDKLELDILRAQVYGKNKMGLQGGDVVVPRSQSVAVIGRIDENAPCEFGDDIGNKVNIDIVLRSRSHAIPRSRARFV